MLNAQINIFPHRNNFDSTLAGKLPPGWISSTAKSTSGDFRVDSVPSSSRSAPKMLLSTDSKIPQYLLSGTFDFTGKIPSSLEYFERRSSTHTSGILLEAVVHDDSAGAVIISDTLKLVSSTSYVQRLISLPSALGGIANVRFRWRIIGNGSGSTGSLRIDDLTVTVRKSIDLAATNITFSPMSPAAGKICTAFVTVKNYGIGNSYDFALELIDSCSGRVTRSEKQISRFFSSGDSAQVEIPYQLISAGKHFVAGKVICAGDEELSNNTAVRTFSAGYSPLTCRINEIMYLPADNKEWVEIYNQSFDTLDLSQWKIGDRSSSTTIAASWNTLIPPQSFFIIAKDTTCMERYGDVPSAVILRASLPSLNNDSDAVVLKDPLGTTIDSVYYRMFWGGGLFLSLERKDTLLSSIEKNNWGSCRHPFGATPGFINSLTPKENDIMIDSITCDKRKYLLDESPQLIISLSNTGKKPAAPCTLEIFNDINKDSLASGGMLLSTRTIQSLQAGESVLMTVALPPQKQGIQTIIARAMTAVDDDPANNIFSLRINVGVSSGVVAINEIMYAPTGDSPEWIEGKNIAGDTISISGWTVSDASSSGGQRLFGGIFSIPPSALFVIAADSSFADSVAAGSFFFYASLPSLNNTTPDAVVFRDQFGETIDSVRYSPQWGNEAGTSLQRIDPFTGSSDSANWIAAFPSPGSRNISEMKNIDGEISQFSWLKSDSGGSAVITIRNCGREELSGMSIDLFNDFNRNSYCDDSETFATVPVAEPLRRGDSLRFETVILQTFSSGASFLCAYLHCAGDERLSNNTAACIVKQSYHAGIAVINEIMYDPLSGSAEYIELCNIGDDTLSLSDWMMTDGATSAGNKTSTGITAASLSVPPHGYAVIAEDSSIFSLYPHLQFSSTIFIAGKELGLGNGGDDVILLDHTGNVIDSVRYSPAWHVKSLEQTGRSLEKISPALNGSNSRSWSSCVDRSLGTPGLRNSIYTEKKSSASGLLLSPNPFSPDDDGVDDFLAVSYRLDQSSSTIRIRIFDSAGRMVRTLAQSEPAAAEGTVIWNGRDDNNKTVRIGMYIILFEALDNLGGTVTAFKEVVVAAKKL